MGLLNKNTKKDNSVLSQTSEIIGEPSLTPTSIPTPTLMVLPTLTPTPFPTRIPTPTTVPQPKFKPEEIQAFIERFAAQYSVDPNVLRYIAVCESGFNPNAVNGLYAGLYQFSKITWKSNRLTMGEDTDANLRFNAEEATQTAAYLISRGRKEIWPNCYP
jgi:soluble lytic murein transglycosylase-like protein